jgi:PAS domain S-box-containing protein
MVIFAYKKNLDQPISQEFSILHAQEIFSVKKIQLFRPKDKLAFPLKMRYIFYAMVSLRYKIGSGYFVVVVIALVTSAFAILNLAHLRENVAPMIRDTYSGVLAAENLLKSLDDQQQAQLSAVISEKDLRGLYRSYFNDGRDEFLVWMQRIKGSSSYASQSMLIDSMLVVDSLYLKTSDSLFALLITHNQVKIGARYQNYVVQPLAEKLRDDCSRFLEVNQNAMARAEQTIRETTLNSIVTMMLAAIASIVISVLISIRFTRNIIQPAERLTKMVRRINQGQLNQKIDISTDDEIGELSGEFNKMTERLRAYEEMNIHQLIAEKRKSETIVANIAEPVIVTDSGGHIVLMNQTAAAVFEVAGTDWLGRSLREIVGNNELEKILENRDMLSSEQEHRDILFTFQRNDITTYYRPRQTYILDEEGSLQFIVTLLYDVTRFKMLETMKSEFIATVSHELRTPITSLGMEVDILQKEVLGGVNKEQKKILTSAKDDVERLRKLVKDLLDLSQLESGKYELKKELVRVERLVEEAVGAMELQFSAKNITMDIRIPPGLPAIVIDLHQYTWVITNLLNNALRHTASGGSVVLAVQRQAAELLVRVADTGEGIPKEYQDRIFDKFVQVKSASETTPGSVGLGLAIAREIVEEHGGKIWVRSEVGIGSTFYFTIPLNVEKKS